MKTRVSVLAKCVCMAILGFITAVPAQAGVMHNMGTTPGHEYVDYANSGLFESVIPIEVRIGDSWFFRGSSVAIANDVVLFSAHQARPDDDPAGLYDGYSVHFTSNFFQPGPQYFDAIDVVVHPDYAGERSGPDLALAFFEPGSFQVDPVTLYSGPHVVDTPYHIAGFGQPGTPSTGLQNYDGNRRAGTNLLTSTGAFGGQYLSATFVTPLGFEFQELGLLGTPGDSGGGWFIDVNGELQLAGITSLWSGIPAYGAATFATPFTPETLAWINSEIQSHAVPEPSSAALLLVGALGARRIRKRTLTNS